ncbi:TetR/AcrR family transcriptional regulator [Nakamurella sp.]|uniref:TetR/AcrR family transcriptional regulator n=1 Tax=Nakamurella sp. TaxID=1869182 RepID=UPI003B3B2093
MAAPTSRVDRPGTDRFDARRAELADAALATLGELGYARTSLREIAQKTAFSHGLLHYYFHDKTELLTFCVRRYKATCVTRYDEVIARAGTAADLAADFADALATTLEQDLAMHRLWYDLRSQSTFEASLRPTVIELDAQLEAMIWRVVERYAALSGSRPRVERFVAYATLDGLFENCLVRQAGGDVRAAGQLRTGARWLLGTLVAPD